MPRRRLSRLGGVGLALSVVWAFAATTPVLAAPVKVKTKQISIPSPFMGNPCTQANPLHSPGFAQETSVAVNPRNPRRILVSWIQDGRTTDLVMASRNGGRSFSPILVPGLSACTGGSFQVASDPGVRFNSTGRTAYFSAIVVNNPNDVARAETAMYAFRSRKSGFSWSPPFVVQGPTGQFWDLPVLTPHPRRADTAYYAFDLRLPPDFLHGHSLLSKTTDGGRSWSTPRLLYDPQTSNSWPGYTKILVNRDGSLLAVSSIVGAPPPNPGSEAVSGNPTEQLVLRSKDGGRTWGPPITIGTTSGRQVNDPVTNRGMNAFDTFASQTVAPNGDVYVSWLEPGDTNASSRVAVVRSSDGGRHWKDLGFTVSGQAALPTVEVAGNGTVGVLYYQIAPASSGGNWPAEVKLATSRDRGRHWRRRDLAGPFNLLSAGNEARPCCFLGDYLGMAPLPNGLAAAFSMGKPIAQNNVDAYFSRITTPAEKRRGAAPKRKAKKQSD